MNPSIYTLFLLHLFLFKISGEIFEDSISSFNISSDLYIDQEFKFTPDAEELKNSTTSKEKRIYSIEFDEQEFCQNSYYEVLTTEIDGVSYISNVSDVDYLDMLTSVYIEEQGVLLTLDKYMNLHEFQINNSTYERKYVQMIQPSLYEETTEYNQAWIFYSTNDDIIVGYCESFYFLIYLSDITSSSKTSSSLLNCTSNQNSDDYGDIVKIIQSPTNSSKFLVVFSDFFHFSQILITTDETNTEKTEFKFMSGTSASTIRDASLSGLNVYVLQANSEIITYSFTAKDDDKYGFDIKNTLTIDQKLEDTTFMVTKIGSANAKINDQLFLVGGYQITDDDDYESYCVIEFFVDSNKLVTNRYYCSEEEIQEIQVFDRFAFVRRKSIHQFLYHSIPQELLPNYKSQSYYISQQLMHATIYESGTNQFSLIALQKANQYSISMSFIEENLPRLICLADDDTYDERNYHMLYKMKTSHCESMQNSFSNGCTLNQEINIDLKEYDENKKKTGLIIGIIFGCIALLIICTLLIYYCLNKRFQQQYEQLKENYEAEKYQTNKQQYQSPQPVKQDDVQIEL